MLNKSNEFQVKINKFPFDDEHVIELPMGIPSAKIKYINKFKEKYNNIHM